MSFDEITQILGEDIVCDMENVCQRAYAAAGRSEDIRQAVVDLLLVMTAATLISEGDEVRFGRLVEDASERFKAIYSASRVKQLPMN